MKNKTLFPIILTLIGLSFSVGTMVQNFLYQESSFFGFYLGIIIFICGIVMFFVKIKENKNRITSRLTDLFRYLFPILIAGFCIVPLTVALSTIKESDIGVIVFLAFFFIILFFVSYKVILIYVKIKNILFDNNNIIISSLNNTEVVLIDEIVNINIVLPGVYAIKINRNTKWGKKIYFMVRTTDSFSSFGFSSNAIKLLKNKIKKRK